MDLDPREIDIRRWWGLLSRRYQAGTSWLICSDWPRWRDIGYLLTVLDRLRAALRSAELAADDGRATDEYKTPRHGTAVPTSEDTIAVDWTLLHKRTPPSPALVPRLPTAPPIPTPDPADRIFVGVTRGDHWNAAVKACTTAVQEAVARCLYEKVDVYVMQRRIHDALANVHKPTPMDNDEAYHR